MGGVDTRTSKLRALVFSFSMASEHCVKTFNWSIFHKYRVDSLRRRSIKQNIITRTERTESVETLPLRIGHHVHKYDHVFAFWKQLQWLHWAHHINESIMSSKEDINASPVHSALNYLEKVGCRKTHFECKSSLCTYIIPVGISTTRQIVFTTCVVVTNFFTVIYGHIFCLSLIFQWICHSRPGIFM